MALRQLRDGGIGGGDHAHDLGEHRGGHVGAAEPLGHRDAQQATGVQRRELAGKHGSRAVPPDRPAGDRVSEFPRHPDRLRARAEHGHVRRHYPGGVPGRTGDVTASTGPPGTTYLWLTCGMTTCPRCYPPSPIVKYFDRITRLWDPGAA